MGVMVDRPDEQDLCRAEAFADEILSKIPSD